MHTFLPPEQYQAIFEALPGAFLLLLPDDDFTIVGVSNEYLRATLRQREEIIGHPLFEMFPDNPDTPEANSTANLSRSLRRVVASRQADVMPVQRYDVRQPDGAGFDVRYWSPTNAPVLSDEGQLLCIIHRVDNVTDYIRLTEENAQQRTMAEQLNAERIAMEAEIVQRSYELDKVHRELQSANAELSEYARKARHAAESKDQFLAMLGHELRNPLSAMASALQLWNIGHPDEARQQGLLAVLQRQVTNLTRLVDDLLEMSRIDRGAVALQLAPLDLRDIAENAMHAVRQMLDQHRLSMSVQITPGNFTAIGDATRLEQALTNLLSNAVKFSAPGGQVALSLASDTARQGWAQIVVKDNGRGIPADKLDAIFDMFVQVDPGMDRARGGLGIGLALVRAIVQLHGGTVHAASPGIGQGSSFIIALPLLPDTPAPDDVDKTDIQSAQPMPLPVNDSKVVLVEDNTDARAMLSTLIAAFGYAVVTAEDGLSGLEKILEVCPDTAIIDIGLPGIDGLELARRVRAALGRSIRLIALTGYSAAGIKTEALEAGFDLHITKPCAPDELASILATR